MMHRIVVLSLACFALLVAALVPGCSSDSGNQSAPASVLGVPLGHAEDGVTEIIPIGGGAVENDWVRLEIPAGALSSAAGVTLAAGTIDGRVWAEAGAGGARLRSEMTVVFRTPDPDKSYRIRAYDRISNVWTVLPTVQEGERVSGRSLVFGRFELEDQQ